MRTHSPALLLLNFQQRERTAGKRRENSIGNKYHATEIVYISLFREEAMQNRPNKNRI